MKYYAIRNGRKSNLIVTTWRECSDLVDKFHGAEYKSFGDVRDAQSYLDETIGNKEIELVNEQTHGQIKAIRVNCKANCEMQINGLCTQNVININKGGQCSNY